MKKLVIISLLLTGLLVSVFAGGVAESKFSIGAGYTGTTVTDIYGGKASFKGFELSLDAVDKPSYYSDLVFVVHTAYSFNPKLYVDDVSFANYYSSSFGVNLTAGIGYEFTFEPVSIVIGGGLHMNEITASRTNPWSSTLMYNLGIGAVADFQFKITDMFFIDLAGDFGIALFRIGNIDDFQVETAKSSTNFNIKLGAGFRIK